MDLSVSLARLDEIDRIRAAIADFRGRRLSAEAFQALRLQFGVYGQRDPDAFMVRVRVPGGRLNPAGLRAVAAATAFSTSRAVHLTTRQDVQIYDVALDRVPEALRALACAGLTTRESSGNTVRNVVGCPFSGVCPREHVDVDPFVQGITRHFLRNPLSQSLPRKFKISVSGCEADCAQALIHDLGVVAVRADDGRLGFRLLAGGGLGQKPAAATVIEPFLAECDLLPALEAVVALHDRHSDRLARSRSRLKFLLRRLGAEQFVTRYRAEFARTRTALPAAALPRGDWTGGRRDEAPTGGLPRRLFKQKQSGLYAVPVAVPLGELDGARLEALADVLESQHLFDVRATPDQNLLVTGVPEAALTSLAQSLERIGLGTMTSGVVACRGTRSCSLGITASLPVAAAIERAAPLLRVCVSGCPNGCAQPETADIGLSGFGRRHHGRLIPHYQLCFGGGGTWNGTLAFEGPAVPAARADAAVRRVVATYAQDGAPQEGFTAWARRRGGAYFESLLADLAAVSGEEAEALMHDVGATDVFRVPPAVNECGRTVKASPRPLFVEAARQRRYRDASLAAHAWPAALDAAESMLHLVGGMVSFPVLREFASLAELADVLDDALADRTDVAEGFAEAAARLSLLRQSPDQAVLRHCFLDIDGMVVLAAERCRRSDPALDLRELLPAAPPSSSLRRLRVVTGAARGDAEVTP
jgi:sulfite reductase (ferredoxin)